MISAQIMYILIALNSQGNVVEMERYSSPEECYKYMQAKEVEGFDTYSCNKAIVTPLEYYLKVKEEEA